jgi:integrase/recombinase XerD
MPDRMRLLRASLGEYFALLEKEKRTPKTVMNYRLVLEGAFAKLDKAGLNVNPKKVRTGEIDYLRANLTGGERYIRWQIGVVGNYLKWTGNAIVGQMRIGWPQDMRINADWLEPEEAVALRNCAEGVEQVVVHFEMDLCLRRIEVSRLRVQDLKAGSMSVLGKGRMGGKWRTVAYRPKTREIIESYLVERQRLVAKVRKKGPYATIPDAFLIHERGGKLCPFGLSKFDYVLNGLEKRMQMLYGKEIRFSNHTLRRTGGRLLWKAGVPLETIADIMGHEDVRTTIRYLGINLDDQSNAMRKVAEWEDTLESGKRAETTTKPGAQNRSNKYWSNEDDWIDTKTALSQYHSRGGRIER